MPLHVEFMNAPRGSFARAANAVKKADGGIFWWTIAIVILVALAACSWIASIFVFTHPERPYNYKLLTRIHRLEELKQFTEKDVPKGKSLTPPELFQRFAPLTEENLVNHNYLLRRNYITNFKGQGEKPFYVRGRFKVMYARPLTEQDVVPRGLVARAVAVNEDGREYRNVIVEYVLPTEFEVAGMEFAPGDLLDIDSRRSKTRLYGAIINIQRLNEDVLVFTVVPLMYGEHLVDPAKGRILTAVPPERLNMGAPFPLTAVGTGQLPEAGAPP